MGDRRSPHWVTGVLAGLLASGCAAGAEQSPVVPGIENGRNARDADPCRLLTDAQLGEFGLADPGVGSAAAEGPRCEWRGASGNYGDVVVGPSYEVNRLDCREFTHTVYIGGRARVARGTACRQPDATWRII